MLQNKIKKERIKMSRINRFWVRGGMDQETEVLELKIVIGTDYMDIRLDNRSDSKIAKASENLLVEHIELPLKENITFRRPDLYSTNLDKALTTQIGIVAMSMIKNFKADAGSFLSIKIASDRYLTIAFKTENDIMTMKVSYSIDDGVDASVILDFNNIIKYEVEDLSMGKNVYIRLPIFPEAMHRYPIINSSVDMNGVAINADITASPIDDSKYLLEEILYKYSIS